MATGNPVYLENSYGRQREMVYWAEDTNSFADWVYTSDEAKGVKGAWKGWKQQEPGAVVMEGNRTVGVARGYPGFV